MIKFSKEFKHKVVQVYLEGKRSGVSIGREYGTDESMVRLWVKQYKQHRVSECMHSACGTDIPCREYLLRPKDFIRAMKPERRTLEPVQQRNLGLFRTAVWRTGNVTARSAASLRE